MSYNPSNSWITPKRDTIILRYCQEFKFKDLINTQTLYFNELLNYRKNDKREGLIPEANKEGLGNEYLEVMLKGEKIAAHNDWVKKQKVVTCTQRITGVNCWNLSKKENKRMWNEYALDKRGVIIVSTIGKLIDALSNAKEQIYIGKIKYVSHKTYVHNDPNPFSYAFLKDKAEFEWEDELRLITIDIYNDNEVMYAINKIKKVSDFFDIDFEQIKGVGCIRVNCEVNKLIAGIIISPWADESYCDEIKSFLKSNHINCFLQKSHFKGICNADGKPINL